MGFDTFLGNSPVVANLRQMLAAGRAPGALLFTGPEGVGKKTLALMFAKALNCERRRDDFCGECGRCRKVDQMLAAAQEDTARRRGVKDTSARVEGLAYFDVHLIEPLTRYILTEQIRQLRSAVFARPFELPSRVLIIDEAQAIHWQAVDLLLKVLEEPPETATLILLCSNPFDLRTTIRSRCQRIAFKPAENALIEKILRQEARVPESRLTAATRAVAGSVAQARNFRWAEFDARRQPWLDWLEAIAPRSVASSSVQGWKRVFATSKALADTRDEFEAALRIGSTLVADLLRISAAGRSAVLVNVDLASRLHAWAAQLGFEAIAQLQEGLHRAYRLQVRNVNQELGLEALAAEVAAPARP